MPGLVVKSVPPSGPSARQQPPKIIPGRSQATVVLGPEADQWSEEAARWLVEYVEKSTGARLPMVREPQEAEGNVVSVGHTEAARRAGISLAGLEWDGGRMAVRGETLFLLGRDEAPREGISAAVGAKGTCKTVVTFLEQFLGVRWLMPSSEAEGVPPTEHLSVSGDLDEVVQPLFAYGRRTGFWSPWHSPGAYANNLRTAGRMLPQAHSWNRRVSFREYGETHPEFFYFDGEKQHPSERNHLCTTNPQVREILLRELRASFDAGYDWVSLGQSDGFRRCQCPDCEALDDYRGWRVRLSGWTSLPQSHEEQEWFFGEFRENPCERVHLLHKWLVDQVAESHPDKKVHLLVYGPTIWPSQRFDRYGDNVVADVCHAYEYTLPLWGEQAAKTTAYTYFWGTHRAEGPGPKFTPEQAVVSIRRFRDHGAVGIQFTGGGECWGLDGPGYYAVMRLMTDPDQPLEAILDEYYQGLYGEAADVKLVLENLAPDVRYDVLLITDEPSFVPRDGRLRQR